MPEPSLSSDLLIRWAAEAMAPVVVNCSAVLGAPEGSGRSSAGADQPKGINYFGPHIVDRWLSEFSKYSSEQQLAAIIDLAAVSVPESRRQAAPAVDEAAPTASPRDKTLAIEYLTAIPLAVRRSLVPDRRTGQPTLFPPLSANGDRTLIRILPVDVPPFPIGSLVPGTSYELQELIGVGGFGAVYKARNRFEQNQPPRAIKFCLGSSMLATLYRERAILDRLMAAGQNRWSHRIVRLYGYALEVQPPFLVYEFVPGGDLTSHLSATRQKTGRGFRPAMALELVRQVAEALAFAHDQGLVHRDLKPANILVSGSTIKLTDFGIGGVVASYVAWASQTGASMTSSAEQASLFRGSGTPLYMSAEQRRGDNPDPRHDLFSLGVVWYQLLVGDVTRELHPGWTDELTEEFRTPAAHIELIQRCVGYFKKRPAHAGELLALLPPAGKAVASSAQASEPPARRDSGRDPGEPDRLKAELAEQIDQDAWHKARQTVIALLRLKPDDAEALEAQRLIDEHLAGLPKYEVWCRREHAGWVRSVAVSSDGAFALSGGDDAMIRLWSLREGRVIRKFAGHTAAVMSLAFSGDGKYALSGSWDGSVRYWEVQTGKAIRVLQGPWRAVRSVALSVDGRTALWAGDEQLLRLWNLESGAEAGQLVGHKDLVQSAAMSRDGRLAASGSDDKTIRIWDLSTRQEFGRLDGHTDTVTCVAFCPDGLQLASGSSDSTARVWNIERGLEVSRLAGHTNWINSVAPISGGRLLTGSGGEIADGRFQDGLDTSIRLWHVESKKELARLQGHTASVTSIAACSDGRHVLSGSLDRTLRLWRLPG
jgi:serine/threonine protein kinase